MFFGLFALAQATMLHFEVRRHSFASRWARSRSCSALFYLSPCVIVVRVLSLVVVQVWQRHSIVKLVFNAAATGLATTVGRAGHVVDPRPDVDAAVWLAAGRGGRPLHGRSRWPRCSA